MKRICAALVAALSTVPLTAAQATPSRPAVVKSVGFAKSGPGLEISVLIAGAFVHKSFILSSPDRLVIDISPTQRLKARAAYDVHASGVTTIRTGQFKRGVSRVIVDFSGPVPAYDIKRTESGLVVRIGGSAPGPEETAEPAVSPEPITKVRPVEEAKPIPKEEVKAQAAEPVKPAATEPVSPEVAAAKPAAEAVRPSAQAAEPAPRPVLYNTTFGIMAGSYRSDSSRFREVYGSRTSVQLGLNLSRTVLRLGSFLLDASFEARTISRTGKATLTGEKAKISIFPLSLGARLLFQTKSIIPFIGYGADWFKYKETSVVANTSGWASGDHFQAGLFFVVPGLHNLRLKLYSKYTRVTATENGIKVKLGGPEFGVGVSFGFNFLSGAVLVL
jgi:hypothetical protein